MRAIFRLFAVDESGWYRTNTTWPVCKLRLLSLALVFLGPQETGRLVHEWIYRRFFIHFFWQGALRHRSDPAGRPVDASIWKTGK